MDASSSSTGRALVDASKVTCGEDHLEALTSLAADVFPKEQRAPKGKRGWRVPERIEEERAGKRRLVLGDATLADCVVFWANERKAIEGPFVGIASDATWRAFLYQSEEEEIVVVRDGAGTVRAARHLEVQGSNGGAGINALDVFPDGKALAVRAYRPADGWDHHFRWLMGFQDDELRVLFKATESDGMGALDRFDVEPEPASTPPRLSIFYASHASMVRDENGGIKTLKPRSWKKTVRWDAASKTFR